MHPALDRLIRLDAPEGWRRWIPEPLRWRDPVDILRWVLVICQGGLTIITWKAWGPHEPVPRLPIASFLPSLQWGWFVLGSLVVVAVRPRVGIPLHVAVVALAIAEDTMRVQSHWISLVILIVATGPWRHCRKLGWAHLSSLWLWAGIMKAISSGFAETTGAHIAARLGFDLAEVLTVIAVPAWEIAIGVLAAWRRTREWAIGAAVALHIGSIVVLGMTPRWAIFWWNAALVVAALVLLRDHVSGQKLAPRRRRRSRFGSAQIQAGLASMMVAALFVMPAGVLTGQVNPYLGHVLYTGMTTRPLYCTSSGECSRWPIDVSSVAMDAIQIPPSKGTFVAWFGEICSPGDELHLSGMHLRPPLDRLEVAQPTIHDCPR